MVSRNRSTWPDEQYQRMIDETSLFLTWALAHENHVPRIPKRPMDNGGFSNLLRMPGAQAAVNHWWSKALERVEDVYKCL